jgi:hypothetical protein
MCFGTMDAFGLKYRADLGAFAALARGNRSPARQTMPGMSYVSANQADASGIGRQRLGPELSQALEESQ